MNKKLAIIGLGGTNGAGKDTVAELLAEHYNYVFITVTELLRQECRKRGIPVTRENTRTVSAEWRRQYGGAVLVDRAMESYRAMEGTFASVVMSSLRNPIEADRIHELGGTMVWVDADSRLRYDRIQANAAARGRAGEDNRTFDEFLADEQAEMHPAPGADQAVLNSAAVKERCDIFIQNNTTSLETLRQDVAKTLGL